MNNLILIKEIAISALKKAYQVHEELGARGEEIVQKNQFGEMALRADVEMEEAVIKELKRLKDSGVPIRLKSEEHGVVDIGENPICLGVLDGLDGSGVYKKERDKGRYGTMLGVFSGLNPKYDEYLFSGIMEPVTKRLFFTVKNMGSFVIVDGEEIPIHCSGATELRKQTRIHIDEGWGINKKVFSRKLQDFNATCLRASEAHYANLASGSADLVLECTRKGNLEIAVAYGLVTEAGGVAFTLDEAGLGQRKYSEFGQEQDEHIPVVFAATEQLAKVLIRHVNQ